MRLLASTDIALRVLMVLARSGDGQHMSVEALAAELGGLSRHNLHKIVQDLTAIGVTRTLRGAGGGVMLAVRPKTVRVGTVIRLLEAGQAIVECYRLDGGDCTLTPECRLRGFLNDARNRFYESLDGRTLADCLAAS